jgi:glycosyltransferase involved in cell wall biosynthesis
MSARRILFVSAHPRGFAPSQRFRFEQYVDYLGDHGFETKFSSIVRPEEYPLLYAPGNVGRKGLIFARGLGVRLAQALRRPDADVAIVQREAIQLGTTVYESALARSALKLVFDFDDAIWLPDVSPANRRMSWLKRPGKVPRLIGLADQVWAGNRYLAEYASQFNHDVRVVPTTVDTDRHRPRPERDGTGPVCLGWTGSPSTLKHFELAVPVLLRLRERFGDRIRFKVIGDGSYRQNALGLRGTPWRSETEIDDLSEIDVGLMPLPDDEWAKGKCGLKALQFMAMEMPVVTSPAGVNTDIISDDVNGYLARTDEEWLERLSSLITSVELRRRIGRAARETVVERYSVASQRDTYLDLLRGLTSPRAAGTPPA